MTIYRLHVEGHPQAKGSMTCVGKRGKVQHQVLESDPTGEKKRWRRKLTDGARLLARRIGQPLDGPLIVGALVVLERPKSVRLQLPTSQRSGDIDKLLRAALDCLTDAGVIVDDSRVIATPAAKVYDLGRPPGITLYVGEMTHDALPKIWAHMVAAAPELAAERLV
ncbi:MAG: RusA family crossover junction endodeoxyribonuclease [Propionibacteriaceae bacterium]|nr:RusA family crossover junction endodeoxyribonuclease [Propionibacteriaceae bacterium]